MRTDITKIGAYQRPVPQTCRDLGEWEKCLWFQLYAAVLQVALFTSFSTLTLERALFTDASNPSYYVDGKLTVSVRLAVAFALSAALMVAIMLIRSCLSELPQDVAAAHEREKVNATRSAAQSISLGRAGRGLPHDTSGALHRGMHGGGLHSIHEPMAEGHMGARGHSAWHAAEHAHSGRPPPGHAAPVSRGGWRGGMGGAGRGTRGGEHEMM